MCPTVKKFSLQEKNNFPIGNLEFPTGVIEFPKKSVESNHKILTKFLKDFKI